MKTYIYTLSDPDTLEVRYVGKTINPKKRLEDHLNRKTNVGKKRHLNYWLCSLFNNSKEPIMTIVAESETDWQVLEREWIMKFDNLCNHTLGGEGTAGFKPSVETLEKRSKSMIGKNKGKKWTTKQRELISAIHKEKHHTRGENSPSAKCTEEQVKEIKRLIVETSLKKTKIAEIVGVSTPTVYGIFYGKTWKHIN